MLNELDLYKYLTEYFEFRRAKGYKLKQEEEILRKFFERYNFRYISDLNYYKIEEALKRQIQIAPKSTSFIRNYIVEIQKHLNAIGISIPVINRVPARRRFEYRPHVYTAEEISNILRVAEAHQPANNRTTTAPWEIMPPFIILLLGTGLRPQEAKNLRVEDVNLNEKIINVIDSKNHIDRIVPFDESVKAYLQRYYDQYVIKDNPKAFFFSKHDGTCLGAHWLGERFKEILVKAKITHTQNGPRLYDFRHTFCTYKFYEWVENGINVYSKLPYLSAYLGHKSLTGTEHYLHMAKDNDSYLRTKINELNSIFKKEENDE